MRGNFPGEADDSCYEALNADERAYLAGAAGAILSEDSQGFVSVDYYDIDEALNAAWAEIEQEQAEDED